MKLRDIIETVPGNTMLDVRKNNERRMYMGEAQNYIFRIFSDGDMENTVFTFFPLTNYDGTTSLIVYMDEGNEK